MYFKTFHIEAHKKCLNSLATGNILPALISDKNFAVQLVVILKLVCSNEISNTSRNYPRNIYSVFFFPIRIRELVHSHWPLLFNCLTNTRVLRFGTTFKFLYQLLSFKIVSDDLSSETLSSNP